MHNLCRLRAFAGQTLIARLGVPLRVDGTAGREEPQNGVAGRGGRWYDFGAHVCILRRMHDPNSIRRSTTRARYFK